MIVRLDKQNKLAKYEMYVFQRYALHESIVVALHFDGTSSILTQPP